MEEFITTNLKEITALAAILGVFLWQNIVGTQRAFAYHERRIKELSDEYRRREEEQEERNRFQMKEILETARQERADVTDKFCEALKPIAERLGAVEQKIDRLTT